MFEKRASSTSDYAHDVVGWHDVTASVKRDCPRDMVPSVECGTMEHGQTVDRTLIVNRGIMFFLMAIRGLPQ